MLFTISNFNDYDQDLKITQMYLDYNVTRKRGPGVIHPAINDTRSGRINLGEFELKTDNGKTYIDNSEIFTIPKNQTGHFKLKIKGSIEMCSRCTIKVNKSDLVIEFVEPEYGNVVSLREHIDFNFRNGRMVILPKINKMFKF